MSDPPPAHQATLGVGNALAKLRVTLARLGRKGFDVVEPANALVSLRGHGDLSPLDGSTLCIELTAVARRLETLSGQEVNDRWETNDTLAQVADVLRTMETEAAEARQNTRDEDPLVALLMVRETLSGLPDEPVEQILGAPFGEVVTWGRVGVPLDMVRRVRVAANVLEDLSQSMDAKDMPPWLRVKRTALGGKTGFQVLEHGNDSDVRTLQRLARSPQLVQ